MARLSSLTKQHPVQVVFESDGEVVTLVVDAYAFTPRWARRVEQGAASNDIGAVVDALADLIVSWDVVDDQNVPVAPADGLAQLPLAVLVALQERITEATSPASEEGNASSEVSSSPGVLTLPQESPNGQQTSPSPLSSTSPSPT